MCGPRWTAASVAFPFFLLASSCTIPSPATTYSTACLKSFNEFAYTAPAHLEAEHPRTVLPASPWKYVGEVPQANMDGYQASSTGDAAIARSTVNGTEIWFIKHLQAARSNGSTNIFAVYETRPRRWRMVSAKIADTDSYVQRLFATRDGRLWGSTIWDLGKKSADSQDIPALSVFDDRTQSFAFANGAPGVEKVRISYNYFPWPEIVLDRNDVFWIFAKDNGLYRYDPLAQSSEKVIDLSGQKVTDTALSPDGSIYYAAFSETIYSRERFFQLSNGMLSQFKPRTSELISLAAPGTPWPAPGGILADHNGNLWLGAEGYRDGSGDWHLLRTNVQEYFQDAGDIYWASPLPVLESSNGLLWFEKYLDDRRADGTAWLDPRTGNGCMFTNVAARVIEDSERRLWLAADDKLFEYSLNP